MTLKEAKEEEIESQKRVYTMIYSKTSIIPCEYDKLSSTIENYVDIAKIVSRLEVACNSMVE